MTKAIDPKKSVYYSTDDNFNFDFPLYTWKQYVQDKNVEMQTCRIAVYA